MLETIRYSVRWKVSADGSTLLLDNRLDSYRPHETELLEFALDPYNIATGILSHIDSPTRESLAIAIMKLFGPMVLLRDKAAQRW